ncbi:hypothetical protein CpecG_0653 [Chlamydia pecorum MC/MarsBar]|uniref:hypothetical protein n=1 Tax=Chlamydia pecorum TaxID=85991 RepID=UPI0003D3CDBC|nr:hypothetical protein [Chlamydia pecorum]ETF37968.1 hypothetical protein CpecF_0654 [Chlamydia pecorum DBDeUG]ETF38236.1 hypothetical protein CpecG_0653 [Chlamydia pecorum MC/MarsBar]ETF40203.1 hypothetical protein CpecA_0653 [Chlamydia pecorum IPTaLE]UBV32222.1 hypothetical protein MarsBar_0663 [Chlamydia pecorum]UBV33169.1 hypothetical protein DBDeUG_0664 [Chlamydia pecorum]
MRKMSWLKLLGETVLNSWWVILSLFIGGFIYDRASIQLKHEELRLKKRVSLLQEQITHAQEKQQSLQQHLCHWNDPIVIESALIQKLGLIPKGYTKICFFPKSETQNNE